MGHIIGSGDDVWYIDDQLDWIFQTVWREPFTRYLESLYIRSKPTCREFLVWLKNAGYVSETYPINERSEHEFREQCAIRHPW